MVSLVPCPYQGVGISGIPRGGYVPGSCAGSGSLPPDIRPRDGYSPPVGNGTRA